MPLLVMIDIAPPAERALLVGAPRKMVLGSWERLREPDAVVIDRAGYQLLFQGAPPPGMASIAARTVRPV